MIVVPCSLRTQPYLRGQTPAAYGLLDESIASHISPACSGGQKP